jgi:hypothetical protein
LRKYELFSTFLVSHRIKYPDEKMYQRTERGKVEGKKQIFLV